MKKLLLMASALFLASFCMAIVHAESKSPSSFMEVQIFRGDPPGKSYKVLGDVDVAVPAGMERSQAITVLKKEAFNEYQADAVINVLVTEKRTGGAARKTVCPAGKAPCETTDPATFTETHATGTAIKWK